MFILACSACVTEKLFVYVRFIVAAVFDFVTGEDWREYKKQPLG